MTIEAQDIVATEKKTTGATKNFRQKNPKDMLNRPCHIHSAFVDGK
jgi:hypothetical protein